MPRLAMLFGSLLISVGLIGYLNPSLIGTPPEKQSPTALIPAFFGGALLLLGLISRLAPNLRKHAMHFAAMVGLLGVIGGAVRPIMLLVKGEKIDTGAAPFISQMLMIAISALFLFLCVRSFIAARKAREAAAASTAV
jgi:membrane associated rhomboid family serine protease